MALGELLNPLKVEENNEFFFFTFSIPYVNKDVKFSTIFLGILGLVFGYKYFVFDSKYFVFGFNIFNK